MVNICNKKLIFSFKKLLLLYIIILILLKFLYSIEFNKMQVEYNKLHGESIKENLII
jgi:hypothetical protein